MSGQVGNNERPQEGKNGFVYIIHAAGTNRVKIGYSLDPARRLLDLQTASPFPLLLVGQWPGETSDESCLHRHCANCCVHLEWFEIPVDAAVAVVEQYFHLKTHPPEPIPELPIYIADLVQIKTLAGKRPISNEDAQRIEQSASRLMDILEGRLSPELLERMTHVAAVMAEVVARAA